jgi:sulfur relay (sulfurtransferase) DsrC/TusE family protein
METIALKGRSYPVDAQGFLIHREDWDEGFAEFMAPRSGIPAVRPGVVSG